ncbi:MAG: crossover junction endodeoxyribonuclease RuvC [Candidatus Coatesbacteria bacterium]|nr:MAG: crossover junction endodeoxyribonuclease RuvC [Candidatus Coatesbacteria bacterium]
MFIGDLKADEVTVIIGVDPGLAATGAAALVAGDDGFDVVFAETMKTSSKTPVSERLSAIETWFAGILEEYKPARVSVEEVFIHGRHPTTAVNMAQARGVVLAACGSTGVEVLEYAPKRVKQAITGSGAASKEQVQKMVLRHLNIEEFAGDEHAADAAALALCAAFDVEKGDIA